MYHLTMDNSMHESKSLEKIFPLSSPTKVFSLSPRDLPNSVEPSRFSENIDTIAKEFSTYLPEELTRYTGYSINDFFVVDSSEILFLLYRSTSVLCYYNSNPDNFHGEVSVTEDSLQTLIVDPLKNLVVCGSGLFESKIFLYSLNTLESLTTLSCPGPIKEIASSLTQGFLVSLTFDLEVYKWELNSLGKFTILSNETYQFVSICDKKGWVALASNYGKVTYLADVKYEIKEQLKIKGLKVSASGRYMVIDLQKRFILYKLKNSVIEKLEELSFEQSITSIDYSAKDVLVVAFVDGNIFLYDHRTKRPKIYLTLPKVKLLKFGSQGFLYATTSSSNLFRIRSPVLPKQFEVVSTVVTAFSTDSTSYFFGSRTTLKSLNLTNGGVQDVNNFESEINRIHFLDSYSLFIASKAFFWLFHISSSKIVPIKNAEADFINSIVFDSENQKIYAAGSGRCIRMFSKEPFIDLGTFGMSRSSIQNLIMYRQKQFLISRDIENLKIWNLANLTEEFEISEKGANATALSVDDTYLIISKKDGSIILFDLQSQNILYIFNIERGFATGIYHTKNSKHLILACTDFTLKFFDFATLTCVFIIKVQGEVGHLRVSDDEKFLAYKINQKTTNFYIIENPLKRAEIQYYGTQSNVHSFINYFLDIKNRKPVEYNPDMENCFIFPFRVNMLHLYSYYGMTTHVKNSLNNNSGITEESTGSYALDLALKGNHKNSVLVFIKYFIRKIPSNPLIASSLNLKNLMEINALGFTALQDFYDSLLCKNTYASLPLTCKISENLPKFFISHHKIPDQNWFFEDYPENTLAEGTSIEFLTSAININMTVGSQESIDFLKSILFCESQDIFRSKFLQYYIKNKWQRLRIFINIEAIVYICYLILMWVIAFDNSLSAVNVLFFILGFCLSAYEVLQIFGGIEDYLKDIWNYVDTTRTVFLIVYTSSSENGNSQYSTIFLVLCLISMARGITYFRAISHTRYMINLITEVLKDIFPFLVICAYSTVAFGFLLMLMSYESTQYFNFFIVSFLGDLGNVNSGNYNPIQWACFLFFNVLNPVVLMNLLIALMGDTHDRVQEGREVADCKELASMVLEVEIATIWKRRSNFKNRLHICKEVDTKDVTTTWLGKVREIKIMVANVKEGQNKLIESNSKILSENLLLKEQISRVEKMLSSIKDKIVDTTDSSATEIRCTNAHELIYQYLIDQQITCSKCSKNSEVGYFCKICIYLLCKPCYKTFYKEKLNKIDITCYRMHQLTWISDHSQYTNYEKKVFGCVGCKKKLYKDSFNCKKCKWDICFKCIDIICAKMPVAWTKSCSKNHSLSWNSRPHTDSYRCNVCTQNFPKAGSFRCENCDYDVCIRCFDDL